MKFGLPDKVVEKIQHIFAENARIDKAIVFGSRAKGNYKEGSDIDIAIKGQDLVFDDILSLLRKLELPYEIDLINYETIKEPDLKDHIKRVGIELYSRWKSVKLQEIVSKLGDGLHGTPEYDIDGEYYFINGNNLIDGKIVIKENTQRVTEQEYLKYKKELNDRTILLGINGTIGNVAIYNGEKCILGKSACYFNVINDVSKDYIKYVVMDKTFQTYIENFANGSTIMNVSLKVVRDYEFALPPIPEQTAIAKILTSLDDKINLLHRQNKTLEQLAETLFRQWFVEEAEESWEVEPLGKLGKIICGKTPSKKIHAYFNGEYPFIKIPDMHGKTFVLDSIDSLTEKGLNSQQNKTIPPKSICVSCIATVGLVIINAKTSQTNQQINSIIPAKDIYRYFIYLKMLTMKDDLLAMASGGTATDNLNTGDFSKIPIQLPTDNKLKEFHETVNPLFEKIYTNEIQVNTLTKTRNTLLPKLMSGEVRVKSELLSNPYKLEKE